jgi:hypothetical protein
MSMFPVKPFLFPSLMDLNPVITLSTKQNKELCAMQRGHQKIGQAMESSFVAREQKMVAQHEREEATLVANQEREEASLLKSHVGVGVFSGWM